MDEDTKQILKEELALHKESLAILKKIHRDIVYRRVFHFFKWVIIIALTVFGYIQAQPYFEQFGSSLEIQKLIKSFVPKS